jgi:hypothetical protein
MEIPLKEDLKKLFLNISLLNLKNFKEIIIIIKH